MGEAVQEPETVLFSDVYSNTVGMVWVGQARVGMVKSEVREAGEGQTIKALIEGVGDQDFILHAL